MSKRLALYLSPLFILAIAGGVFFGLQHPSSNATAALYKESGVVLYRLPNQVYKTLDVEKVDLVNHSYVKTQDGTADVMFPDGSMISLDKNTELQINIEGDLTSIKQIIGNTYHRILKLFGARQYKVETPFAVAVVRGTKFGVAVTDETAVVYVTEHQVDVQTASDSALVTSGKEAIVTKHTDKIPVVDIPQQFKQTEWMKQNQNIDNQFNKEKNKQALIKWLPHRPVVNTLDSLNTLIPPTEIPTPTSPDPNIDNLVREPKNKLKDQNILGITAPPPKEGSDGKVKGNSKSNRVQDVLPIQPTPTVPAPPTNANTRVNIPAPTSTPVPTSSLIQTAGDAVDKTVKDVKSKVNDVVNTLVTPTIDVGGLFNKLKK